ncbi:MAG: hypothetical protein JNM43_28020 [Planctomycetaceae bacterium]|nr:hypothetical protein [Planctomycetaceae bacterium]
MKAAYRYFVTELPSCFQWTEFGKELAWSTGTTIAFRPEIIQLLSKLGDQRRYVDFATIALAMAVTRASWQSHSNVFTKAIQALTGMQQENVARLVRLRCEDLNLWPDVSKKLSLLNQFATDPRVSFEETIELLAIVTGMGDAGYSVPVWTTIQETFAAGLPEHWSKKSQRDPDVWAWQLASDPPEVLDSTAAMQAALRLLRIIRIAKRIAAAIPGDTLEELFSIVKTGISDVGQLKPAEVMPEPENQSATIRGLLKELEQVQQFRSLVKVTNRLIAAISLPRDLSEPDDLQMGGISDIANRGTLDKLLLSELAHDDLTLSVRLALNEALYLRRESPPSMQKRTRCILIDSSLPTWGIPRLYATAAALALHVTTDRQTRLHCFRLEQNRLVEAPLTSSKGVEDQLAALSGLASPAKILPEFFARIQDDETLAEPVLITTRDALEMPGFRQKLDQAWSGDVWLIIAERDGKLEVLQKTRQGMSIHRRVQLPLAEILSEREAERLQNEEQLDDLPAIFRCRPFPLLLQHEALTGRTWRWEQYTIAITNDGRLMLWRFEGKGARQISEFLPIGPQHSCFVLKKDTQLFCVLCVQPETSVGTAIEVDYTTLNVTIKAVEIDLSHVTDVTCGDYGVYLFGNKNSTATYCCELDLHSGIVSQAVQLPTGVAWRRGRVVRIGAEFHVVCLTSTGDSNTLLSQDSANVICTLQKLPPVLQRGTEVVEYINGHYAYLDRGVLYDAAGKTPAEILKEEEGVVVRQIVATDGEGKVEVKTEHDEHPTILDLKDRKVLSLGSRTSLDLRSFNHRLAISRIERRTPHYRFGFIATDGKSLWVENARREYIIEHVTSGAPRGIRLRRSGNRIEGEHQKFEAMTAGLLSTPEMHIAQWPDGGTAWLDFRGLLHLRSSDPSLAEVTLTLRDGWLAGWTSTGKLFGDDYHFDADSQSKGMQRIDVHAAWTDYVIPILESLR